MNLLMLSGDSSVARGQEGAFHQMLAHFSRYWSRIDILCPAAPGASPRVLHGNIHVHPAAGHRLFQPWFIHRQGSALLAQRRYDLVTSHDFGFFYNGLGAWWLLRDRPDAPPLVSEVHHIEGYPQAVTLRERAWRLAARRYLPWAAWHVAAFRVVNQREVPEFLRRCGIPDEQILVLPSLYLDFNIYHPRPEEQPWYDVLFVGRLSSNKGVLTLLEAVRQVMAEYPRISLAIRGDGPLHGAVRRFITAHGMEQRVHMLPRAPDADAMARLYNQARMLVCASTVEGGPRVTAEAMACGTPVITTPVGIMPEIIRDSESGLFFPAGDAEMLAGHIRRLLADPALRRRIGQAGREAVQPYQAARVIEQYARAYHELIAHQREGHHAP